MKKIVFILLLLAPFFSMAQTDVFEAVEEAPYYPGGEEERQKFMSRNIAYPDSALKYGRQGKVYVKFIVETDSTVSKVHTVKTFDEYCAAECERVVKMMKWVPGKQKGKAVRVWVVMPISFRLK
jgi:protein TonB